VKSKKHLQNVAAQKSSAKLTTFFTKPCAITQVSTYEEESRVPDTDWSDVGRTEVDLPVSGNDSDIEILDPPTQTPSAGIESLERELPSERCSDCHSR
jgi:hypothetical protein